jgi:hypothetical protein
MAEKYDYKEWSEEDRERVTSIIRNTVPDGRMLSDILSGSPDSKSSSSSPNPLKSEPKKSATDDFFSETSSAEESEIAAPISSKKSTSSSLDDLYNDL